MYFTLQTSDNQTYHLKYTDDLVNYISTDLIINTSNLRIFKLNNIYYAFNATDILNNKMVIYKSENKDNWILNNEINMSYYDISYAKTIINNNKLYICPIGYATNTFIFDGETFLTTDKIYNHYYNKINLFIKTKFENNKIEVYGTYNLLEEDYNLLFELDNIQTNPTIYSINTDNYLYLYFKFPDKWGLDFVVCIDSDINYNKIILPVNDEIRLKDKIGNNTPSVNIFNNKIFIYQLNDRYKDDSGNIYTSNRVYSIINDNIKYKDLPVNNSKNFNVINFYSIRNKIIILKYIDINDKVNSFYTIDGNNWYRYLNYPIDNNNNELNYYAKNSDIDYGYWDKSQYIYVNN